MGDFYASDMVLGGLFQQTIVMEMNEKDDKKKLESEVSAKGNILTAEAKSSISSSASVSVSIHNKRAKTKLRVLGGDTEIWLGLTEKNQASILKKWSDTIEPKNEVPVEMTLHPIWELLDGLDKKWVNWKSSWWPSGKKQKNLLNQDSARRFQKQDITEKVFCVWERKTKKHTKT